MRYNPVVKNSAIPISYNTVRTKVIITFKLLLYSKFSKTAVPTFGRGATIDDDSEACQGTECNLHGEISSDNPHL